MVTPDMIVLARMLWEGQDVACQLADIVDPSVFQSKPTRSLFLLFAREAPKGFSAASVRPVVEAEAPHCTKLLHELIDRESDFDSDVSQEYLAESVAAWGRVERLKRAAENATKDLRSGVPYADVRGTLDKQLSAIDLSALTDRSYDDKQDMARRVVDFMSGKTPAGLPFGFRRLDKKITPMREGNLIVIPGRPGVGKSTIMKNVCRNGVRFYKEPSAYFTFEMLGDEILPSFACMDTGLSYVGYIRKTLTEWERKRLESAVMEWVNDPLFRLNERSAVTPDWILRTIKRYRAEGITTFYIDHLHRVAYEANAKGDIRLSIGAFARQLKSFAVDNQCRIIAAAQLTKGSKHEEPSDEMIREANNILEEADKIIPTWRPLVAGTRSGDGSFMPTIGAEGRRIFWDEAPKGSDKGEDRERVYMKLGKQRISDDDGFVAIPFNHQSGLMYEDQIHSQESAA